MASKVLGILSLCSLPSPEADEPPVSCGLGFQPEQLVVAERAADVVNRSSCANACMKKTCKAFVFYKEAERCDLFVPHPGTQCKKSKEAKRLPGPPGGGSWKDYLSEAGTRWSRQPDIHGGKCNTGFWGNWLPKRLFHTIFVACLWTSIWLLGTYPMGRELCDGWRLLLPVYCFAKAGFSITWTIFTNFNHSHVWNEFLANDPERSYPVLSFVMKLVLGGRHRFNEMLFHDVHHAFPNAVGTMSQRGRFHGYEAVMHAATQVLDNGLFKKNGDEQTTMQKNDRRRSLKLSNLAHSLKN